MKQVIPIKQILPAMISILETTAFSLTLTNLENESVSIFTTADFYNDLIIYHEDKSILKTDSNVSDLNDLKYQWNNFKAHYIDEWQTIFTSYLTEYDPLNEYSETRTITPNVTTATTTEHGHTIDYSIDHNNDTTTYGGNTTAKINTYDGVQHNSTYTSNGGSDSRAYKENNKTTNSGVDTVRTSNTGSNTETKTGYKNSPAKTLSDNIIFKARCNLRDLVIKQFANEFLFYDNHNNEIYAFNSFWWW